MKIFINDKEKDFTEIKQISVEELLKSLNIQKEGIAVCVNGDIIRKVNFHSFLIKDGDRVEIITMVGGG